MKHAVPDYPDHPELGMHAEDIPYMPDESKKHVTEQEAIEFLDQCKMAYRKAVTEAQSQSLTNFRYEIRYWEEYLSVNFPEERRKREPPAFGGKTEPMSREELTVAMDIVYERLKRVHDIQGFGLSAESRVIAEVYGTLKTVSAILDEVIRKLP